MGSIRTDLAMEVRESLGYAPSGVAVDEWETETGAHATRVQVKSVVGERALGKPIGRYVTLEMPELYGADAPTRDAFARDVAEALKEFLPQKDQPVAMVIGLGNRSVTPDALGPGVCDKVFVTRHIKKHIPEAIDRRASSIAAFAPGVLGVTGMETSEVVRGIAAQVRPDVIIAIDALAARKTERIGSSVQISDSGIAPGSGLGNHRVPLNRASLGMDVIAIGVPMVAYASTIAADLIEGALGGAVAQEDIEELTATVISAKGGDLVVTPKEIDILIDKTAETLASALNYALNPCISPEEIRAYMC